METLDFIIIIICLILAILLLSLLGYDMIFGNYMECYFKEGKNSFYCLTN